MWMVRRSYRGEESDGLDNGLRPHICDEGT